MGVIKGRDNTSIPFRSVFRSLLAKGDSAGDDSMVVDGSGTAVTFTSGNANGTLKPWVLTRIIILVIDNGVVTNGQSETLFGAGATLTNGCQLYITDGTNRVDLAGGYRTGTTSMNLIKSNKDLSVLASREYCHLEALVAAATVTKRYYIDFPVGVAIPAGGMVKFVVADKMGAGGETLLDLRIMVEGYLN
jgi:hypothetical protein